MFTLRVVWTSDQQPQDGFAALEFRRACGLRDETRIRASYKRYVYAYLPLTVNDAERYKALFSGDSDEACVSLDGATAAKFVVDVGEIGDVVGLSVEKMLPHKDALLTMAFQQQQRVRQMQEAEANRGFFDRLFNPPRRRWRKPA